MKTNTNHARKALLALFAMLMPLLASAYDFMVNGIYYEIVSTSALKVGVTNDRSSPGIASNHKGTYSGDCVIPTNVAYNGEIYTVSAICDYAFHNCDGLSSVTIPNSIVSIGKYAFLNSSRLTSITIPGSVVSMGDNVFYNCRSLTSVNIEEGVTYISSGAFTNCISLTSVTLPKSLTDIQTRAFDISSQNDLSVYISDLAAWCNIQRSFTPFSTDIQLYLNGELITDLTIFEELASIKPYTFYNCKSITSISFPQSLISINEYAFSGCSNLTSITIPEGLTLIGSGAFSSCTNVTSISLPKSLKNIESYAFAYYTQIEEVYSHAEQVPTTSSDAFYNSEIAKATLYVPANAIKDYKNTSPWSNFGAIEAIKVPVSEITLSQSSATLTEGESITLTATVTPEDADDTSVTWSSSDEDVAIVSSKGKVVAMGLGTAIITATANDGSGVSASCEIIVKAPILGKCATPTINYIDGEFVLTCSTEGAVIKTIVVTENDNEFVGEKFDFLPTHTFTAYATKENYEDSDVATLTICWVPCEENHEEDDEETGILTIPAKPVLISARDGVLTLSGLAEGTEVTLYTTDGAMVAHQQSSAGEAKFTVDTNQVYLVHIGDKVVKIGM